MNRARVPFIVSIDVISWGLFSHRLVGRLVVTRNEGLSLKHRKGCSIRGEAPTRCEGHGAGEPSLGKWGTQLEGQIR